MPSLRFLASLIVLGLASRAFAGDKSPSDADVRKAVARSLPFVEKDGLKWIEKRDCMSCHVVSFMLWAHVEAKAHGITIEDKKLAEWTDWSRKKSLSQRVFFKLDDKAIQAQPESIRPKIEGLANEGFTHESDFVAALGKTLSTAELQEHQLALVKAATLKRSAANDGGGLETLGQLLLGRDPSATDSDFNGGLPDLIIGMQEPGGLWKASGQQPSRRWSRATADQTTTLWTLVALANYQPSAYVPPRPSPELRASLAKGIAAVEKQTWDGNLEWLVARTVFDTQFRKEKPEAKDKLLARQNADGGWSVSADGKSDAFSTGQSLYALRFAGVAAEDVSIRRGQKYLVDSQNEDGSWTVSPALTSNGDAGRHKRLEPIYKNWGTSWAAIGLAKTLPAK